MYSEQITAYIQVYKVCNEQIVYDRFIISSFLVVNEWAEPRAGGLETIAL